MPGLSVQLLGGFNLTYNDQEIKALRAERLILLLSYLFLNSEKPIPRKQLAFTFWADTTEEQARTNLRNLFHHLRKAFPEIDTFLEIEGQTVQWKSDAAIELDVAEFKSALAKAKNAKDDSTRIAHFKEAINIYRGELLPGYYEDWVLSHREEVHQSYLTSLSQLAKLLENSRQYEEAIEVTNRLIRSESLNESAYQLAMRLHALNDDRAGALQAYHACVTVMRRELDMEPSEEIKTLYEQLVRSAETPSAMREQEKATAEIKLVGRKQEWGQLKEAWNFIQKNQARMILLRGESGIGKTRLAEELTTWVQRQGFFTAFARAYPAEGELAYGAVTLWLRSLSLNHLQEVWKIEVARLLPELQNKKLPAPGALSEAWQQQRFHEGLARAALGSQPLLLILDDIQWADRKTLEWLRFLFRFDSQARFMLLATARNEDLANDNALHDLIDSLRQDEQYAEIPLQRFLENETFLLAEQISQNKISRDTAAMIQQQTEGLPLFIVELTRSGLHVDNASRASLPDRLLVALKERLSTLTDLSRNAAEAAAVTERDFSAALLAQVADLNEADLLASLDELWQRHILRESERGRYDFSHDKLREYIYNSLSPARRQSLHKRVAEALTELEPDDFWGRANHLEKSGALREASEAYFHAAKREAEQASYPAAYKGFSNVLALLEETAVEKRAETLTELARVSDITGDTETELRSITEALQLTAHRNDLLRLNVLTVAGDIAYKKAQIEESRTWFEMALELARKGDDSARLISLLAKMGDMEIRAGRGHPAKSHYEEALALARREKNHELEAETLMGLGFILPSVGDPLSEARKLIEESVKLRRLMGDRLGEARGLDALIGVLHAMGQYEEGLNISHEALAKNQAVNYRRGATNVASMQGLFYYELGQLEKAKALFEQVRVEYAAIDEQDGYGLQTSSLGLVATAEEKWEDAERYILEALAVSEANGTEIFTAFYNQDLGTLYALQNRWEKARPHLEKAFAINLENNDNLGILYGKTLLARVHLDEGNQVRANELADEVLAKFRVETFEEGGILRWLWQFKRLLEALDREAEAAEVLTKARELFQSAAANIQNEELRKSFRENFPHHRGLL
ncbi:MAG: tetratricopeptide repeat protein [Chloroflexi bacterium]|nr:tetratricopeptide repeat protein [Chloroflexota bacterium]